MPVKRRERLGIENIGLSSKQQPGIANVIIKQTNSGTNSNNNSININDNNNLILKQQQSDRNSYLGALTKSQLKIECRKRGSKTTGNKMNLLQRLGYKMTTKTQPQQQTDSSNMKNKNVETNGLVKSKQQSTNGAVHLLDKKENGRDREKEQAERAKIVLWRHPIQTSKYCGNESVILLKHYGKQLLDHKKIIAMLVAAALLLLSLYHVPGRHQFIIDVVRENIWFVTYWVGLGVLSSVGLGTGLHTFLLYLGPHIASVTLAAYECNSVDFPQPPYPDEIICPEKVNPKFIVSLWNIMCKVRAESFLWGVGTALGELPPYFMARAARMSGYDPDDAEDLKEFEELQKKKATGADLSLLDRAKLSMERIVERVGFMGILACASIPNPLFDLAGITCGHFLVPFWTFFGATLIGKAVIKMHIQKIFVIIGFNETLIEKAVDLLGKIPVAGRKMQEPFKTFLKNQKTKLHRGAANRNAPQKTNILSHIFESFVICMVVYFVVSIVNSLAQSYHKRLIKEKNSKNMKKSQKKKD